MAEQLAEVGEIAGNAKAKPTFDNTIIALERSGATLGRATTVLLSLIGADANPAAARSCRPTTRRSSPRTAMRSR